MGGSFFRNEGEAFGGEVGIERSEGTPADGDEAGFVSLSGDTEELVFLV